MAQLCSLKQGENELAYDFIHKWKALAYKCSDVLPQASLVNICRNNMRARIRSMIIGNKSKNLRELLEASMEAETVIKDLNSQKSSKKEPTTIPTSKPKKKKVLNVQTKSAPRPPKKAENKTAGKRPELFDACKERVEKKYPFDEDVEEIFGVLLANGKLTLPDSKRPGDVGKTNDPRYYPYHQMVTSIEIASSQPSSPQTVTSEFKPLLTDHHGEALADEVFKENPVNWSQVPNLIGDVWTDEILDKEEKLLEAVQDMFPENAPCNVITEDGNAAAEAFSANGEDRPLEPEGGLPKEVPPLEAFEVGKGTRSGRDYHKNLQPTFFFFLCKSFGKTSCKCPKWKQ
ncbi:hypothetical protein AAC387_Pa08g1155 [Persea americana]